MATFKEILTFTPQPYLPRARAHPFVKWAGGKRSVVPEIAQRLPATFETYWEPFTGGGAVFFAFDGRITKAQLSDINAELMLTYKVVRDHVEDLIVALEGHAEQHERASYYTQVRKQYKFTDPVPVAARFIYLNRTCFNGLYRVNQEGQFNVPKGLYTNPTICDADALRHASTVLEKATLRFGSFERATPEAGDFLYCDPPYDGAGVAYSPHGFADDQQRALRDTVLRWAHYGAQVMVSNADTPRIRQLYADDVFTLHSVSAPRNINCDGSGRGKVAELIITSYTP